MGKVSLEKKYGSNALPPPRLVSLDKNYKIQSSKLSYVGTKLFYAGEPDRPTDLATFFAPASAASPMLRRLADDHRYTNTALAYCDLMVRRAKNNSPSYRSLQKGITCYWNTILYLRGRGVYRLADATQEDLHALCKDFGIGGWTTALGVQSKVLSIISAMDRSIFSKSIRLHGRKLDVIAGLSQRFWQRQLGFKPRQLFTEESRKLFEEKATDFGYTFSPDWASYFRMESSIPSVGSVRLLLAQLNNLFYLPHSVDKLKFLPFEHVGRSARKYGKRIGERTLNLGIDEATHVLGKAFDWLYNFGPKLVEALEFCRDNLLSEDGSPQTDFFQKYSPFKSLADELGCPEPMNWNFRKNPKALSKRERNQNVEHFIAALQGACAVTIAGLNARRSGEVCDKKTGLRFIDLISDEESDLHLVNFYIEKSYQDRHPFYVNKSTVTAINLLHRLRKSCAKFQGEDVETSNDISLFSCNTWTRYGPNNPSQFYFGRDDGQTKSLSTFITFLDKDFIDIELKSHMWRRFYALIYVYRYDHSDLQSLSQHLCHEGISQTFVYVTDTSARSYSEQIESKVPSNKYQRVKDSALLNSLQTDFDELRDIILVIQKEKFSETVQSILRGGVFSGGFPRLIRKLYLTFSKETDFRQLSETQKSELVTSTLLNKGYTSEPMYHGQCNAPDNSYTFSGKCSSHGRLEKVKASASFCQGCMYHSKSNNFIKNLVEDIKALDEDITSDATPDFIRAEAIEAKQILIDVIQIHNVSAQKNSELMKVLVNSDAKK